MSLHEEEICNKQSCPTPCKLGKWSVWGECSKTCGKGERTRKREKEVQEMHGGKCSGELSEIGVCNAQSCPEPCKWGQWDEWRKCSVTCGRGKRTRIRPKKADEKNGGKCPGLSSEEGICNTDVCPEPCMWGLWSEWSECSKSCGKGNRSRKREYDVKEKTKTTCTGSSEEDEDCNYQKCPEIKVSGKERKRVTNIMNKICPTCPPQCPNWPNCHSGIVYHVL